MARIKYGPDITPLVNEHFGFVFQRHASGQSMTTSKKNDRFRNVNQSQAQQDLMKAIRYWRNMTVVTKLAWSDFAAAFPQPSKRNPAFFLSGYQLFLKRSHYCFLNHGTASDFMDAPELTELPAPEIEFKIEATKNTLDVTQFYINNFGILPKVGQYILIRIIPMAIASGQFFAPLEATVEVEQVFVDGLFVSFNLNANTKGVVFSVYLSKIFHQSITYIGTKVRYMGCFTPKTYIELTDTDNSYAGQAGKIPTVKDDESGLEFADSGGGGISCEDLIECPLIIQMISQTEANSEFLSKEFDTSIPPIKFGLLYNAAAFLNVKGLSATGWRLPTSTEVNNLRSYLGGGSVAGGPMKEVGLVYWDAPNTGATNTARMNVRGSGSRSHTSGVFTAFRTMCLFATSTLSGDFDIRNWNFQFNATSFYLGYSSKKVGLAVRFVQNAAGVADGVIGIYIGNNGRFYRTVTLNEIRYMADNLAETLYNDGSPVPRIISNIDWVNATAGAFCVVENDWANV